MLLPLANIIFEIILITQSSVTDLRSSVRVNTRQRIMDFAPVGELRMRDDTKKPYITNCKHYNISKIKNINNTNILSLMHAVSLLYEKINERDPFSRFCFFLSTDTFHLVEDATK